MTICYCDKCGKEVNFKTMWKMSVGVINTPTKFGYELCSECTLELRHWVEDKPEPTIIKVYKESEE